MITVNTDKVIKNFKKAHDICEDFSALWVKIIGPANDKKQWTLRGSVLNNYMNKSTPDGYKWPSLTENYLKQKINKVGNKPMGVFSGRTFDSFMNKNTDSVVFPFPKKLIYGTSVPYAYYLQFGSKKRPMLSITKNQKKYWKTLVYQFAKASFQGAKDAKAAADTASDKVTK